MHWLSPDGGGGRISGESLGSKVHDNKPIVQLAK